jgi:hypothetical protein
MPPSPGQPFNGETPPEGAPLLASAEATGQTRAISGQIDSALAHELGAEYRPEHFIEDLAQRLARKTGGQPPSPPGPFGIQKQDWVKLLFGIVIGGTVFLLTWYNTVNRDLNDRPTRDDVKSYIRGGLDDHAGTIHPETKAKLESLEDAQQLIRESQIRQESTDAIQTEVLQEIKGELVRRRR